MCGEGVGGQSVLIAALLLTLIFFNVCVLPGMLLVTVSLQLEKEHQRPETAKTDKTIKREFVRLSSLAVKNSKKEGIISKDWCQCLEYIGEDS